MSDFIDPSLLPPPLRRDLNCRALESVAARLSGLNLAPLVIYDVDNASASVLPHLAEQFNVLGDSGWDVADTDAERRALVKEAIALHKLKGTRRAVERALELIGVVAVINEWWQRDPKGAPYTFALNLSLKEQPVDASAIDGDRQAEIQRTVSFWKPARSHFSMTIGYDLGAEIRWRIASVFCVNQTLVSAGSMKPLNAEAMLSEQIVTLFSPTQVLTTAGTIKSKDPMP